MTQAQPNLLELAKQGNAKAIATLMNYKLQPEGITAKAYRKNDCLKVVLESAVVPNQQTLVSFILAEMISLEVKSIRIVKVHGLEQKTFDFAWHQVCELGERVKSPSASAKPTSPNTQASSQEKYSRNRVSESEFKAALEQCSITARKAHSKTVEYAKQTETILQKLNNNLSTTSSQLLNSQDVERFEFAGVLREIVSELKQLSTEEIETLVSSLNTKREHLEDFTIALFGRTKAGKSTIREALTRGDGGTIGKGAQRTTRDVREYRWQGLRLLDTPGIEAYQGDEDTAKANEVIDQSDMILFLASDDAVQPGKFKAMAQLQRINKYFAVILNVKDNIEKTERFIRFIERPEKVFDKQRLAGHQNHIRTHVNEKLKIENVDIVCIHALAAFFSTKPEYIDYSERLWELSKVEELYSLITWDIKNNGQKRRVSTFFDSAIKFIGNIEIKLLGYQRLLEAQVKFMYEKIRELNHSLNGFTQDSNLKLERECSALYFAIKQWIPYFVDNYTGKEEAKGAWNRRVNQRDIETTMKGVLDEIVLDLQERLKEFDRQYQYDIKGIKIDLDVLDLDDIDEEQFGRFLRRASVVVGAVGAVSFFFNPLLGLAAAAIGFFANLAGDWIREQEKREFQKKREDLKASLIKKIEQKEKETIKAYKKWLHENLLVVVRKQMLEQTSIYIQGLSKIKKVLTKSHSEIKNLKLHIKQELFTWN